MSKKISQSTKKNSRKNYGQKNLDKKKFRPKKNFDKKKFRPKKIRPK